MKLTQKQLRSLITEALKPINEAAGDTVGDELGSAVTDLLKQHADELLQRVLSLTDDGTDRPVRYEDVEGFAAAAVKQALASPDLYEMLESLAINVLHDLMEAE